ncbi:MAG: thiamine pyrophosphate-binding protein [Gammaproteobacteria bacterium]|nr:thiamine pyrophosphate-binding protein [Gammaproteobacteria bacterium]
MQNEQSGGQVLIKALESLGAKRVFCVPGESYLPALQALSDSTIETIVCRQEGGAAMMAEATGKLSGAPGIAFVTRGPGATNALSGIHVAQQDSTPVLLFIGQIATEWKYRDAFQEVDYQQLLGGMCKWVTEIDHVSRIEELVSRAWHTACAGRPGPVAVVLPENTLYGTTDQIPLPLAYCKPEAYPHPVHIEKVKQLLSTAARPLAILGGSGWTESAVLQFQEFALNLSLPVATSFRRQTLIDNTHPCYVGDVGLGLNPALKQRILEADVLLLLGGRFSEVPSQDYALLDIPLPKQKLIHVHPGAEELGKVNLPMLAINCSPESFCASIVPETPQFNKCDPELVESGHRVYLEWSSLEHTVDEADLMKQIVEYLQSMLDIPNTIVTTGAGNYSMWIQRFWKFQKFNTQVAPTSGSMGYGFPAAVATKLQHPEKTVIALAGDGCFQMTHQEFATAAQLGLAFTTLIIDNGMYGTIKMHQVQQYPDSNCGTELKNPDFALWAQSYDAFGARVESFDDFKIAFSEAQNYNGPSILHIIVNPNAITPVKAI